MTRIDYVVVSTNIVCMEHTVETWFDFIMPNRGFDHVPTAVRILIPFSSKDMLIRRRLPAYDRKATQDLENMLVFKQLLQRDPRAIFSRGLKPASHDAFLGWRTAKRSDPSVWSGQERNEVKQKYLSAVTIGCVAKLRKSYLGGTRRASSWLSRALNGCLSFGQTKRCCRIGNVHR